MQSRAEVNADAVVRADRAVYYRVDSSRLSFAELWRIAKHPIVFAAMGGLKLLRKPLSVAYAVAPDRLEFLDPAHLPHRVSSALANVLGECQQQGFAPQFATHVPSIGNADGYNLVLLGDDGKLVASTICSSLTTPRGTIERVNVAIASQLADGRTLSTSSAGPLIQGPPTVVSAHFWAPRWQNSRAHHRARLAALADSEVLCLDEAACRRLQRDLALQSLEYNRRRGVMVPLSQAEVARLRGAYP